MLSIVLVTKKSLPVQETIRIFLKPPTARSSLFENLFIALQASIPYYSKLIVLKFVKALFKVLADITPEVPAMLLPPANHTCLSLEISIEYSLPTKPG